MGRILIFSVRAELFTKYADCPVTSIVEVCFVYSSREIFTSVFFDFRSPLLRSKTDVVTHFIHLLLKVSYSSLG